MCTHYGSKVCDFDGKSYYAFPSVQALAADDVEAKLRTLGFGYRAGYISKTAQQIVESGGESFLHQLRHKCYDEARKELLKFTGIGPKVWKNNFLCCHESLGSFINYVMQILGSGEKKANYVVNIYVIGNFFKPFVGAFILP